jgi:PKD repeat protein
MKNTLLLLTLISFAVLSHAQSISISSSNVSCSGFADGSATAVATGGIPPYTYQWNDPSNQITPTATNLAVGTYAVIVTDAVTVTHTEVVTLSEPAPLAITTTSLTDPSCNGNADGQITVTVSGGVPPYTFDIGSGAQPTGYFPGLPAGSYSVVIMDANGCTATNSNVITENPGLTATSTVTNPSCNGNADGQITVIAAGGAPPYTFDIGSGAQPTGYFPGLPAGSYSVMIMDANGCNTSQSSVISESPALIAATTVTAPSCNGNSNGQITTTASGGVPPYTYQWSDPSNQITATATGLVAGVYSVVVTDANGCTATSSTVLSEIIVTVTLSWTTNDLEATFTSSSTNTTIGWQWDFGDGFSSSSPNPMHTYASPGTYSVCLITFSECGFDTTCADIVITGPCTSPTSYSVSNVQADEATLNWNAMPGALQYKIRFREVDGNWDFSTVSDPTTFKINTGLTAETDYEWQVKTLCDGDNSSYGALQTFTTGASYCENPTVLSSSNVTHDKVTFNWNAIGNAIKYKIRYRVAGSSDPWQQANTLAPATSRTRGGLTPSTNYEWQIKVECDMQSPTSYSPLQYFTTMAVYCVNPVTYSVTNLGSSSAQMNWNAVLPNAIQYKVRIRELNPTSAWTTHTVTNPNKFKGNLLPDTDYEWRVKTVCDQLSPGGYGPSQYFSTPAVTCAHPDTYWVDNQSTTEATLNWNSNAYAYQYKIKFREAGISAPWDQHYITPPATSFTKTGLSGSTQYEWKVQTRCTANSPGGYGPVQSYTHPVLRLAGATDNNTAINVFPNPTSGLLTVDLGDIEEAIVVVRNIHGQLVSRETVKDTRNHQVQLEGASGLYTVEVMTTDGNSEVFRVVKE